MTFYSSGSTTCGAASRRSPVTIASASAGNGGGVPPNDGHSAWWSHQSHNRLGLGRKSPISVARAIAVQIALSVRPTRTSW